MDQEKWSEDGAKIANCLNRGEMEQQGGYFFFFDVCVCVCVGTSHSQKIVYMTFFRLILIEAWPYKLNNSEK